MSFVADAASMTAHPPPLDRRRVSTDTDLEMPAVFTLPNIHPRCHWKYVSLSWGVGAGNSGLGASSGPAPASRSCLTCFLEATRQHFSSPQDSLHLLDAASQETGRRKEIVIKPRSSVHGLGGFESNLEKTRFRIYPQGLTQNSEVWYLVMKSGACGKRHKIMKKKMLFVGQPAGRSI